MKMKFIEDLKRELDNTNLSDAEKLEILNDFKEMVDEAIDSGLEEKELENKFGSPEKLASELASEYNSESKSETPSGDTFEFYPNDKYNIVIELLNEDIDIKTVDIDKILVEAKRVRRLKDFDIKFENNTLYLLRPKKQYSEFFHFSRKSSFTLKLPKRYNINDFNFSNINGDGEVKDIIADKVKFKVTNGDFEFSNGKFTNLTIDTINGDINMQEIKSNDFKVSLVSGDMKLKRVDIDNDLNINSVSGDIEVDNLNCKQALIRLVSGDFEGKEFYPSELTVRTVSGDVDIHNKLKDRKIEVIKKSSVSGDININ